MALAPDDLTPGQFVTILETRVDRHAPGRPGADPSAPAPSGAPGANPASGKDYTGAGAVLRVECISLPFVLVRNLTPALFRSPRVFPVDMRRTRLITLSDEYVRSALPATPAPRAPKARRTLASPTDDAAPGSNPPDDAPSQPRFYWSWNLG